MNGIDTSKVFIIAEAGVNHNGSLDLAYQLIDVAKDARADAVKFQTFKAENVVSKLADKAEYQKKTTRSDKSQLEMIRKLELSFEDFVKLKKYCDKKEIMFLSTPFDHKSIDFLAKLVPLYKVGSGEIINLPFLRYITQKRKPIILSTGMANLGEVEEAINTIRVVNSKAKISLLHCTTNYPTSYEEVNLKAMQTLAAAFKLPIGYSDHTLGIEVPVAAVAMGAKIIEKHFTLDKKLPGPDHKASLEPSELKKMVKAIRNIEIALGNGIKKPNISEIKIMKVARRSLIATKDIRAGEIIKESDIAIKRPGTGILPKFKEIVIGMNLINDIRQDEPFRWENFK
ncbi:N-acetylneuraminate synthase [Candidatus Atribacteria bacterium HGW-Atribacteria-1]|nr:MAG: N-acetylneuraminate synthase [Candidatus Atribacteria bacterium HGW-Atribacteria-1]